MEKGMISLDQWSETSQVYFLSHFHADHTKGLSSKWNKGLIYCSPITAKLFPVKFPGFRVSLIRVLEVGSLHSIPLVSPSTGSQTIIQVTTIDAHHCPGAVMYLFRGEFGCLLFTGDFRWESSSERTLMGKSMLLNALGGEKVDFLHLDNTYCNPSYSFPPREVVARQIVKIIASHPQHDVIIAINTLGKEDLLLHIASALNTKIWVWPERLQVVHVLGFFDVFTTNTSLTRIRAVPFYSFSIDTLEGLNSMRPTIGIMPSGLPWVVRPHGDPSPSSSLSVSDDLSNCNTNGNHQQNEELSCVRKFHKYIYTLPYSDHSCFNEIREFVKLVQPLNIKGIVSSSSCYIDPRYYFRDLHGQDECNEPSSNKFQQHSEKLQQETPDTSAGKFVTKSSKGRHTVHTQIRTERSLRRKSGYLGLIMSRVSILRRRKRGAKILEIDIVD